MATTAEPQPANIPEATNKPTPAKGWGTDAPDQPLRPMNFERRALRPDDVAIKITFAGICHSDLHTCRNDWGGSRYPVIPGHEIVGTVTAVGADVTRHHVGDTVAVGCMVDSCMECDQCLAGWEVFCRKGCVQTYNSADYHDGTISKGGYTDHIVVRDHFVLKVPAGMDASRTAPLLCAGITTYSPLRQYNVGEGTKVAVIGLGGLGHMGVKLAAAMGAHVTMITTTPSKGEDARKLGAHDVIISTDAEAMKAAATRFDFILNTIPGQPRDRSLSAAAWPIRPDGDRRRTDADAGLHRIQPHLVEPGGRRVGDRRHSGDPGDARFLRDTRHLSGLRDDPNGRGQ